MILAAWVFEISRRKNRQTNYSTNLTLPPATAVGVGSNKCTVAATPKISFTCFPTPRVFGATFMLLREFYQGLWQQKTRVPSHHVALVA